MMSVNYDLIAAHFDERYRRQPLRKIEARIRDLASAPGVARVLEVGCGTGYWLSKLADLPIETIGADPSVGMLDKARALSRLALLVRAPAEALPFECSSMDLIFCVNAFHHFSHPEIFLRDSRFLLRNGGRLAIFGLDPHAHGTHWYQYEYMPGLKDIDLDRYMSCMEIQSLLTESGFHNVRTDVVEHLYRVYIGADVLNDPFLARTSSSQLQVIPEESYHAGKRAITTAVKDATRQGCSIRFVVDLKLFATIGEVRGPACTSVEKEERHG